MSVARNGIFYYISSSQFPQQLVRHIDNFVSFFFFFLFLQFDSELYGSTAGVVEELRVEMLVIGREKVGEKMKKIFA